MNELNRRCQEVSEKVAELEAVKTALLEEVVGPLLSAVATELESATLPPLDREELKKVSSQLRHDAYYSNLISADEACEILDRSNTVLRRYAQKDELGHQFADRRYVYHSSEIESFKQRSRPPGVHRDKKS